jgi:hypothetical protein
MNYVVYSSRADTSAPGMVAAVCNPMLDEEQKLALIYRYFPGWKAILWCQFCKDSTD